MYGVDWFDENVPPKKKRGRKKGAKETKPRKKYRTRSDKGKIRKPRRERFDGEYHRVGRRKGSRNTAEQIARAGKTNSEGAWRRRAKNAGSEMQSSSGYGDSDYSINSSGFQVAKHIPRDWSNWGTGWWGNYDE